MARRYILLGLIGQSNERGRVVAGDDVSTTANGRPQVSTYGTGMIDGITPGALNGADGNPYGSLWPYLSSRLAREKDIWLTVRNTAEGGSVITAGTTEPAWCGSPLPDPLTDDPLDPNSLLADLETQMTGWGSAMEKWVYISLGQTDNDIGTTEANFRDGLICATNYCLNRGWKVILGFSTTKIGETWYTNTGNPAYLAALANFSGNSNVIAGANLYAELGEAIELYDGNHWALSTAHKAANCIFDALDAAGW